MKVAVAADSAGVVLKDILAEAMRADDRVAEVTDFGVPDDGDERAYPLLGLEAAKAVADGRVDRAVLCCGTGIGMAITANKVEGVRATVAYDPYSVERSIKSNDCQVLCLGGRVIGAELAKKIVDDWLGYTFDPASASAEKVAHITEYEQQRTGKDLP
ncbi:RpiB/LacA/LacB family sugar-phosphate isomerase [Actinomycetospora sp. CA-101289]|uniref:RpiB/LacA/LacB family sugar-phosphate isomerase n=1 Tax=Actinomycetospora sp. CA-101289 TaxID=3239893 RepID=UPI003D98D22C